MSGLPFVEEKMNSRLTQLKSALVAAMFLLPAILFLRWRPTNWLHLMIGFAIGLLYSNGFEYFFHRWALHRIGSRFAEGHSKHHESSGKPNQEEHLNFFSGSSIHVVILFLVNMMPFLVGEWAFDSRIFPGVLIGFVVYFIGMEEIHRRAHTDVGWIPQSWRKHHMIHHGHGLDANEDTNFNIFLPLFDWLLRTKQG